MEEATLDFANAAPGNMGRQRAESDRSGQNQNSFESSYTICKPKEISGIWMRVRVYKIHVCNIQGGRRKYLGSNLKLGNNLEFYLFVGFSPFFNKGMW